MEIPFTVEQFYDAFRDYNEAIWPIQLLLAGLSLVGIGFLFRPHQWTHVALAAFFLGVVQDLSLIVAGVVGIVLVIGSRGKTGERT